MTHSSPSESPFRASSAPGSEPSTPSMSDAGTTSPASMLTHECSFLLRPSAYGVGVFAAHDIPAGSFLRLFGDQGSPKIVSVEGRIEDVPEMFRMYCIHREGGLIRPADFGCMEVGWYLNHSDEPNAIHRGYDFYALRDIMQGEEITIDYNSLEEPDHAKESYYRR